MSCLFLTEIWGVATWLRSHSSRGVATYIRDRYASSVLDQFSIMENYFESVFAITNISSEK